MQTLCTQARYRQAPHPRLIAFCTNVVVPEDVLQVFTGGAYNFHPGPPEYPGSHSASFAIYDQVERYGVTAHEMEAAVDSGAIVGVKAFPVPADIRYLDLEILAYQHLLNLVDRLMPELAKTAIPLEVLPVCWGSQKKSRRDFEHMKQISDSMSEDEIRRRWRAFG